MASSSLSPTIRTLSVLAPLRASLSPHPSEALSFRGRRRRAVPPLRVAAPPTTPPQASEESKEDPVLESNEMDEVVSQMSEDGSSSKFNWRDHWYPVSLVEDLDPALPTPFQLLNREIVIWFDKTSSQWVAMDDKCPHRLAPLSVISLPISYFPVTDCEKVINFLLICLTYVC